MHYDSNYYGFQIKVLESEKAELESRVKELSEASAAVNNETNSPSTQQESSKENAAEKTGKKKYEFDNKYSLIMNYFKHHISKGKILHVENFELIDLDEDEPMDAVEDQSSSKPATEDKSDATPAGEELTQGDSATNTKKDNLEASEDAKQDDVPSDSAMESSTATTTNEMKSDAEDSSAVQV